MNNVRVQRSSKIGRVVAVTTAVLFASNVVAAPFSRAFNRMEMFGQKIGGVGMAMGQRMIKPEEKMPAVKLLEKIVKAKDEEGKVSLITVAPTVAKGSVSVEINIRGLPPGYLAPFGPTLEIYNLAGNEVKSVPFGASTKITVNVSDMAAGVYFAALTFEAFGAKERELTIKESRTKFVVVK